MVTWVEGINFLFPNTQIYICNKYFLSIIT